MWLGSGIAVVQAGSWELPYAVGTLKKKKKRKKKEIEET